MIKIKITVLVIFTGLILVSGEVEAATSDPNVFFGSKVWSDNTGSGGTLLQTVVYGNYVYTINPDAGAFTFAGPWSMDITKRSELDGSIIWKKTITIPTFSSPPGGGFLTPAIGIHTSIRSAGIRVDNSGVYYATIGKSGDNYPSWLIEKRSLSDGSVIWTKYGNYGPMDDAPSGIEIDSTGVYIRGSYSTGTTNSYISRLEKRDLGTGNLLWEINDLHGGAIFWNVDRGMKLDQSGLYISVRGRIQKRSLANGSLVWDVNAEAVANIRASNNQIFLDQDYLYYGGSIGGVSSYDTQWAYGKLRKSDGSRIWHKNKNLYVGVNYNSCVGGSGMDASEYVYSLEMVNDGILLSGYIGNQVVADCNTKFLPKLYKISLNDGNTIDEFTGTTSAELIEFENGYYYRNYQIACTFGSCPPLTIEKRGPVSIDSATCTASEVTSPKNVSETFTATITCTNNGTTTWQRSQGYKLGSQNPADNLTWGLNRIELPVGVDSVAPGASVTFTGNFTAPSAIGNYNYQWQMIREGTAWFGTPTPNQVINVAVLCTETRWTPNENTYCIGEFKDQTGLDCRGTRLNVQGAMEPFDNSCNSSTNGKTFTTAPTDNLCFFPTFPTVTETSTGWSWVCPGICGGNPSSTCTATKTRLRDVGDYIEVR